MIDGVKITDLKVIEDERGSVRHMLRRDDPHFIQFGEIYFSTVKPGVIKAWHLHTKMTLNYVCIRGEVMVGMIDLRAESPTFGEYQQVFLGPSKAAYKLLTIPPFIWNGFRQSQGPEDGEAWIANCATLPHDPSEIIRMHPSEFPVRFEWGKYWVAG